VKTNQPIRYRWGGGGLTNGVPDEDGEELLGVAAPPEEGEEIPLTTSA
jgi:hypothetical protein